MLLAAVVLTAPVWLAWLAVFERFAVVERYRFWQAFRDVRHGHEEALRVLETQFLTHVAS
jgi:hypothetical protein